LASQAIRDIVSSRGDAIRDWRPGRVDEARGYAAPKSLYVHVPVCASKCSYCDFFSAVPESLPKDYEDRLVGSTLARASSLSRLFAANRFDTVYIGGGTPTMLSSAALDRLLAGLRALVSETGAEGPAEWTVEANPDSLDAGKLDIMASWGVTRVSIGVQSLDPGVLCILGRRHGAEEALAAVSLAAKRGMDVSADLIAEIPIWKAREKAGKDIGRLASDALELIDSGAKHLSVYDLTIEEGTPIARRLDELVFPAEAEALEERRLLEEALGKQGLRRYEVSNYAAGGDECLHNLAYWRMASYIGAGPGAVSTIARRDGGSLRIEEAKSIDGYGAGGIFAGTEERIGRKDAAFETIMMAFRTCFGLDSSAFRRRFGLDIADLIGSTLRSWSDWLVPGSPWPRIDREGKPACDHDGLALNGAGLDILNRFLGDCLAEMDRSFPKEELS
jgi:oxygen-independent coproporphyrinogen III oxidase